MKLDPGYPILTELNHRTILSHIPDDNNEEEEDCNGRALENNGLIIKKHFNN